MPLVVIKGFEMYKVWKGKRKIWRWKMNSKEIISKKEKKQIIVDKKLKTLEREERRNYISKSWNIRTSGGFYNY